MVAGRSVAPVVVVSGALLLWVVRVAVVPGRPVVPVVVVSGRPVVRAVVVSGASLPSVVPVGVVSGAVRVAGPAAVGVRVSGLPPVRVAHAAPAAGSRRSPVPAGVVATTTRRSIRAVRSTTVHCGRSRAVRPRSSKPATDAVTPIPARPSGGEAAMLDELLSRLDRLRADADALGWRMEAAEAATPDQAGRDSTGTVTAVVGSGNEVVDVRLDPAWREALGAALPGAVLEAVDAAHSARREAFGAAFERAADTPRPDSGPACSADRTVHAGNGHSYRTPDAVERTIERLTAVRAATYAAGSRAGHVTVTADAGGNLLDVRYDHRWLVGAPGSAVGRETVEAIRAARVAAREAVDLRQRGRDASTGR